MHTDKHNFNGRQFGTRKIWIYAGANYEAISTWHQFMYRPSVIETAEQWDKKTLEKERKQKGFLRWVCHIGRSYFVLLFRSIDHSSKVFETHWVDVQQWSGQLRLLVHKFTLVDFNVTRIEYWPKREIAMDHTHLVSLFLESHWND